MSRLKLLVVACVSIFAFSCATYTLSTDSLKGQFDGVEPEKGTYTIVAGGLFLFSHVQINGLRELTVINENGSEEILNVNQRTQIRVHTKDGDYSTFYFDTMFMKDNCIIGQRTHFVSSAIKPIPIDDVVKIEIQ